MADGRRHPPHLTVFALDQFQPDPAIRHALAETDGRHRAAEMVGRVTPCVPSDAIVHRRRAADCAPYLRLRLQKPCAARQSFPALNQNALFQFLQTFRRRNSFHLRPILAFVRVARMQELFVPLRLVAQEQQALRNPRPAGQWDRHFSENQIPRAGGWASRRR